MSSEALKNRKIYIINHTYHTNNINNTKKLNMSNNGKVPGMSKKGVTKAPLCATIDKELLDKLDEFCLENHGLKRSTAVENAIKKYLEKKDK